MADPIVPLRGRYPSAEMRSLFSSINNDFRYECTPDIRSVFSDDAKYRGWRDVWIALAESQMELGLGFDPLKIDALKKVRYDIDHKRAREIERETKHDVVAYMKEFSEKAARRQHLIFFGNF